MEYLFGLVLAAAVVGVIVWRVSRSKSADRPSGLGGGGRPGADKH